MATLFAWSGALRRRGELDGLTDLMSFGDTLEQAALDTLRAGIMTGDLAALASSDFPTKTVTSEEFLDAVADRVRTALA